MAPPTHLTMARSFRRGRDNSGIILCIFDILKKRNTDFSTYKFFNVPLISRFRRLHLVRRHPSFKCTLSRLSCSLLSAYSDMRTDKTKSFVGMKPSKFAWIPSNLTAWLNYPSGWMSTETSRVLHAMPTAAFILSNCIVLDFIRVDWLPLGLLIPRPMHITVASLWTGPKFILLDDLGA